MAARYSCLGAQQEWTPWRKSHLQIFLGICGIIGILGSECLVKVEGWTPGTQIQSQNTSRIRWLWKESTKERKQDDFICPEGQSCNIANVTVEGYVWIGPRGATSFQVAYMLHNMHGTANITAKVNLTCCNAGEGFESLSPTQQIRIYKNCTPTIGSGTELVFNINVLQTLLCHNATSITNRSTWAQSITFVNMNSSKTDPGHMKRIPSSCVKTGTQSQKTVVTAIVIFPSNVLCPIRQKRAWYDTLLGGVGTVTGTLNSFDIETLANRMSKAGAGIQDVLTLQGKWMPTIWHPLTQAWQADKFLLDMQNISNSFVFKEGSNISAMLNWTMCTMQAI
ncbi:uncharacterized protein [Dendrobates tinctorius]|uniref:uncharacterized protein n=1 Tax=Dendrobates tinctorius TaxID=92724 RepID=UPI003CC9B442